MRSLPTLAAASCALLPAVAPVSAATTQSFGGYPAGTIVVEGIGEGTPLWPDFRVVAVDNNSGPDAVIVFDSTSPTGGDSDLGTPNLDFGGPGIGLGGGFGMPHENSIPLGNVLIIAESLVDQNGDGLVDVPDDEGAGGCMTLLFDADVVPLGLTLLDIDASTVRVELLPGTLRVTGDQSLAGENSVVDVALPSAGYRRVDVCFSTSGALARIQYDRTTSVEDRTWGRVKSLYR